MKRQTITALIVALGGGSAYAANDFVDTAQVISATPIIERVSEPRQECTTETTPQKSTNIVAPILGGIVGGLIGHQVGQGSGQTAATIVGATGGAVAGSMVGDRVGAQSQPVQRCRTIESSREVVNGYNVVYRYNGRDVNVALPYNPGNTIKVGVGIILDDHAADAARDSGHDRDVSRRPQPVTAVDTTVPANNANYTYRY